MKTSTKAVITAMATAFVLVLVFNTSFAVAAFTASILNAANNTTIGSGTSFLTANNDGVQCTSVPAGAAIPATNNFPCTGEQFPATVPATGNSTDAVSLTATGTSSFTSASYNAASCAPVSLANRGTATNPLLPRYGVGFNAGGAVTGLTGSNSMTFNGSNTVAVDVQQTTGLQTFSVGIWFKTSVASGALMGYSTGASNVDANNYDRHLYFNSTGNIVFGTYPGAVQTIQSPAAYNDNVWHFAVGTLQSSGTSAVKRLYIDGTQVATATTTVPAAGGAEVYNGYWRIGQARSDVGWTGTGQYFNGALSNAMVFSTALTAANVTNLRGATTQAVLNTRVAALSDVNHWALNDDGLQTYTGALPGGSANPCSHVRVTVGTATRCLQPVLATACTAPSSASLLTTLVAGGNKVLLPSTPGAPQTITTVLSRDTSYNANYDNGLHLLVPIAIVENGFTQTFSWTTNETII